MTQRAALMLAIWLGGLVLILTAPGAHAAVLAFILMVTVWEVAFK